MHDLCEVILEEDDYKPVDQTFYSITLRDKKRGRDVNDILMEREELRQLYHMLLVEFSA